MDSKQVALQYFDAAQRIVDAVRSTQMDKIEEAAQLCADTIGQGGLVHLFGTGHSRIPVEEMFPRHGSFPGFHPIIDLSMTFHTQVVGSNGQRQAMLIEKMEGLGDAIMQNFVFRPYDTFIIFSNSGVNNVVMEVALGAKGTRHEGHRRSLGRSLHGDRTASQKWQTLDRCFGHRTGQLHTQRGCSGAGRGLGISGWPRLDHRLYADRQRPQGIGRPKTDRDGAAAFGLDQQRPDRQREIA